MLCQFISNKNIKCNNKAIGNFNYCQLKRHHKCKEKYEQYQKSEEKKFNDKTLSKDYFTIINVYRDGACLFTSLSNYINDNIEFFKDHPIYSFINNKRNFEDKDKIETIARFLQNELKDWIFKNRDMKIKHIGNTTLENWVLMIHGEEGYNSIEDYYVFFNTYAGDPDIIEVEDNGDKELIEIPERWGTIVELFAFHKIYDMNINIYVLKRFHKNKIKEVNCTKRSKYARFLLTEQLFDSKNLNSVNLYFNMSNNTYHYEYLKLN